MKRFLLFLPAISMLFSCGGSTSSSIYSGPIALEKLPDVVDIHTDLQQAYLDDEIESVTNYVKGKEELSRPVPVHIKWQAEKKDTPYYVLIGEDKTLNGA